MSHPIFDRWSPSHPDRLQLFSLPTPNGVKVSIMLEEIGIAYEAHRVDFSRGDQRSAEFLALNPSGKVPAIIDPDGPGGKPLALSESGAILQYLAAKSGMLMPRDPELYWETMQWLHWQMSSVGPMFGQLGYFWKFEGRMIEDKRPLERFACESKRLLGILNDRLSDRTWVMGQDYTIADISLIGMVRNLVEYYQAGELVDYQQMINVHRWLDKVLARPAVKRGLLVPA
jgi:GSH-dependent disulfide-bond oxidoreductase